MGIKRIIPAAIIRNVDPSNRMQRPLPRLLAIAGISVSIFAVGLMPPVVAAVTVDASMSAPSAYAAGAGNFDVISVLAPLLTDALASISNLSPSAPVTQVPEPTTLAHSTAAP